MSSIFEGYESHFLAEARLVMLKALHEETDYRLSDALMQLKLKAFGINKGNTFVRNQMRWLQDEVQAVKIEPLGTALMAELTEAGRDHVERVVVLEGVRKPSPVRL